jgi:hypothetical protein
MSPRPEEEGVEPPPVLGVGVVHPPLGEPVVRLADLEPEMAPVVASSG